MLRIGFYPNVEGPGSIDLLSGPVRLEGVEPPAFGTEIQRSIHLSYKRE